MVMRCTTPKHWAARLKAFPPPADGEWRPVVGYEDRYQISRDGRVWSVWAARVMAPVTMGNGYQHVCLWSDDKGDRKRKGRPRRLHRVVAQAWVPNPENKPEVNHRDLNKTNNHADNLEWATGSENCKHCGAHGLNEAATNPNKCFVLSVEDVATIRARHAAGERPCIIARDYPKTTQTYIGKIVHRKIRVNG